MKDTIPAHSDWGGIATPAVSSNGPLDPRTDAEVTEELKAKASQRRGSRIGSGRGESPLRFPAGSGVFRKRCLKESNV